MKDLSRLSHLLLHLRWPVWLRALRTTCLFAFIAGSMQAADLVWDNASGTFVWNSTDLNWGGAAWNNAAGNGAIFNAAGAGVINVASAINVNSINFAANGYTLNGAGSLNFVTGASTLGFGFMNVAPSVTATVNTAISSTYIIKLGAGVLELGGPMNFSGTGLGIDARGNLRADLIVGGGSDSNFNPILGGTIRILNTGVLPVTTRLGVANGLFDLGSNNITIAALTFVNAANNTVGFNPATGVGGAGVFGAGTLRVTGEINVIGRNSGNFQSNSIGSNLDLGGGTQIVRTAINGTFMSQGRALQLNGVLSNGSLLKTFGYTENGIMGNPDGMAMHGNNTYTGTTTLNGGNNFISGTNATALVRLVGDRGLGAPFGSSLTLFGANGSLGSATSIQAVAGSQLIIDNNLGFPAGGDTPTIAAAQNNNRIRDDAEIQLRDGGFTYRGLANAAASETFGNLNLVGGHNNVTLTPNGAGGTVTLTANGNLTLAPRSTLQVTSATLGAASKFFINGTMPAADATGILSRVVGSTDFLTYNGATGLTNYTGYAADFSTAGTNVAVTSAASVASSVNVNAIKSTGTFATTIADGQTLGVDSGMILNISGTRTYTGGTIAFGANPGTFFTGANGSGGTTISSAITGTNGLINANGALTLSGDLSGLTGTITNDVAFATTTLSTNTFIGAIEIRGGQFNINTSQTLAGQGAITMGVPANDAHLINNFMNLNFSGAGAGAIIGRDIIVDNGSNDAAGLQTTFGFIPVLAPLSNTTGSQTLSGNITLNSIARLQGGGGGGTGSTTLSGNIMGPAQFYLSNGRDLLTGSYSNAGGFRVGEGGFTAQVSFLGTAVGTAPINMIGGNSTFIAYNANSLPTGQITVEGTNASGTGTTASINPLQNSTINNPIFLGPAINPGTVIGNVATGITGNWNGQLSGAGGLVKNGAGTLVLGNAANTYTGNTTVNAGTLLVNGSLASPNINIVGGTLGGSGSISAPMTVAAAGTIAPGNSIGAFNVGNLTLAGTYLAEIDLNNGGAAAADLLNITGSFNVSGTLMLAVSNLPALPGGTYLIAFNDGADAIVGNFGTVTTSNGLSATVDYAFAGTDSLGRVGNGNDLAVTVVPEPQTYALFAIGGAFLLWHLARRRTRGMAVS